MGGIAIGDYFRVRSALPVAAIPMFVTSASAVTVPEGGTATFQVKLAAQPAGDVLVTVGRVLGDGDISVTGGASLTFTTANWGLYQTVTLAAAEDADVLNGTAVIRLSAAGFTDKDVNATEADNDAALTFTDDPLVARTSVIKRVHLRELRDAIATLRTRYGLSAPTWTDTTIVAGVTPAKAVHLQELRTALREVYVAAGQTPPTYSRPIVTTGVTVITAVDIAELRAAIVAIW
jgi:hypothetical protein